MLNTKFIPSPSIHHLFPGYIPMHHIFPGFFPNYHVRLCRKLTKQEKQGVLYHNRINYCNISDIFSTEQVQKYIEMREGMGQGLLSATTRSMEGSNDNFCLLWWLQFAC